MGHASRTFSAQRGALLGTEVWALCLSIPVISVSRPLDYEQIPNGLIYLTVMAKDAGNPPLHSTVPVTIEVFVSTQGWREPPGVMGTTSSQFRPSQVCPSPTSAIAAAAKLLPT